MSTINELTTISWNIMSDFTILSHIMLLGGIAHNIGYCQLCIISCNSYMSKNSEKYLKY